MLSGDFLSRDASTGHFLCGGMATKVREHAEEPVTVS